MKNYNHNFTPEQISKMSHNEWLSAGKPSVRFAKEAEVLRIIANLKVGEVYESDRGSVYLYEGGERCCLKNISASNGHAPLKWGDELCNPSVALGLKKSDMTREEFDGAYNNTSNSMWEWCQKNTCD